jgi:hypothetical protein
LARVDPNQVLVAVTGLVGSLLGAGVAFGAQELNWRRARRAQTSDEQSASVHRVLVKANSIDLLAYQLSLAAKSRGSLDGSVAALFGGPGLINFDATLRALHTDVEELNSAITRLWLSSDQRTVDLVQAISDAAAELIAAHSVPRRRGVIGWIASLLRGPQFGDAVRIENARSILASKRADLVAHARQGSKSDVLALSGLTAASEDRPRQG